MGKKSLFFKFFTVLTLLAAIPIIIIITIMSYEIMRYSESDISRSYIGRLKVAENFSKMIFQNIYMGALKMTMDGFLEEVPEIYSFNSILESPDGIMRVYQLHDSITNLVNSNNVLHSVYLLPDGADYIITSNRGVVRLNEFADKDWLDNYREFKEYKSETARMLTRTVSYSPDNGAGDKVITFFYSFTPYTTTVKGTLIFNIYVRELCNYINSNINEGYIIIADQNGDIVAHIQENLVGRRLDDYYLKRIQDNNKTGKSEGYFINMAENERQLVTYYKSELNDWVYIGIFPVDVLMGKVNALISRTIYICLVFVLAGILVSFVISKKMSSPLKKLVEDIRIKRGIDIKNNSETAILSEAFDYMLKEEARLFSILESSRNNNRNLCLLNLLQGKPVSGPNGELTGINFPYGRYICAVILIDKYQDFTKSYSEEQQDYMKTLIMKVSEQLIGKEFHCAGIILHKNRIAIIVNYDDSCEKNIENCLRDIFLEVQKQISKVLDSTISVGIGSGCPDAAGVADSYEQAQEALKYKLIAGHGSINFWRDLNYDVTTYYYPYSIEKYIFNLINSGISEKIADAVSILIKDVREHGCMHYENITQIFIQLSLNTVKFLLDQHLNINMIFGSNYNIYNILSRKETLDDIEEWLVEMFMKIADYIAGARRSNKSYFNRALEYIHEHYKKDIDINTIAENVGISYSHLRKIFKDETGDNIINYINHIRIDESKRLLCQSNMTIREIALNLGYNNEQSFVRFFKKYENISPGEYRVSRRLLAGEHIAVGAPVVYNVKERIKRAT